MADASEEYFTVNCNACEHDGEFRKAVDYCRACREYMCRDCLKSHNKLVMSRNHKHKLIGSQPFIDMTKSRLRLPSSISSEDALFCCHGCATNGDIKNTADFCRECVEYFCSICLMNHNRWTKHTDKLFGKEEMRKMIGARKSMFNTPSGTQLPSTGTSRTDPIGGARPKTKTRPVPSSSRTDKVGGFRTKAQPVPSSRKADKVDGSRLKTKVQPIPSSSKAGKGDGSRLTVFHVDSCEYPSVRIDQDKNMCYAWGSCALNDGGCLVTDFNNCRLKRLDSRFAVVECVDLPGRPLAVCSNSTPAAVSIPASKSIAIVSLGGGMRIVRQIKVEGECCGVLWHRGELICGVGRSMLKRFEANGEETGSTRLVDGSGQYINGGAPRQIAVQNNLIYVALGGAGLLIIDRKRFTTVKVVTEFKYTAGVCVGGAGDVFVCGREPKGPRMSRVPEISRKLGVSQGPGMFRGTVKQYNKNGEFIKTIISWEQLKQREPLSLCYLRERSLLVVTLYGSDEICAFYLK